MSTTHPTTPTPPVSSQQTTTTNNKSVETVVIHCDGSFQRQRNLAGIGYIIETNGGTTLEKHHSESVNATTSTQTEAHACLTAIRAAKKYNPSHLVLYSDCNPVLEKIKSDTPHRQREVYHAIRQELNYIKYTSIKPTPRNKNKKAHALAHLSLRKLKDQYQL
jgi:ribonuclease HI